MVGVLHGAHERVAERDEAVLLEGEVVGDVEVPDEVSVPRQSCEYMQYPSTPSHFEKERISSLVLQSRVKRVSPIQHRAGRAPVHVKAAPLPAPDPHCQLRPPPPCQNGTCRAQTHACRAETL